MDLFLYIAHASQPDGFFELVDDLDAVGGDHQPEGFDPQRGVDRYPDDAVLLYMNDGVELIVLAVSAFIVDVHVGGEGLEVDMVLLQLIQRLVDKSKRVGMEVTGWGHRSIGGDDRGIPGSLAG